MRLTLSRLSTCSSVCELSMICQGKGRKGGLSVIYTHEHRRSRSHATASPPEQWPQRECKCWLGRTLGKSSGRAG